MVFRVDSPLQRRYEKAVTIMSLSPMGQLVRRHDYDRFLTALFAPEDKRESLFALYAFYYEIAKIREITSEPVTGYIRLQWWRETLEGIYHGTPRQHEVALALDRAVKSSGIEQAKLLALID